MPDGNAKSLPEASVTPKYYNHLSYCSNIKASGQLLNMHKLKEYCLFFFFFSLYNIVLVLPRININPPWVYTCSQSRTLLPPPPQYHPSGSSQCTSPKHPAPCIKPRLAIWFLKYELPMKSREWRRGKSKWRTREQRSSEDYISTKHFSMKTNIKQFWKRYN